MDRHGNRVVGVARLHRLVSGEACRSLGEWGSLVGVANSDLRNRRESRVVRGGAVGRRASVAGGWDGCASIDKPLGLQRGGTLQWSGRGRGVVGGTE